MNGSLRLSSGGRRLQSPPRGVTRPTSARVREAVMSLLAPYLEGSCWLDLCSGSGVMSCEALQKGAKRVVAIELDYRTARICKANLSAIAKSLPQPIDFAVVRSDVLRWLKRGRKFEGFSNLSEHDNPSFDLVYLDPPYQSGLYGPVLIELAKGNWLKEDSIVVCEYSSTAVIDIPRSWNELDRRVYGSSGLSLVSPPVN